ncbi:ABC transporter substrate-binding protein [Mesorhizobium neociceri]|uniref:Sugar ABC transporter substrate-binding protein n=1 Tax=Mesorhizobium neociceri TaxID=1307853 RepID=A0A838B6A7_9HYPH|nr:sugar ABC transporter substrate-binding protein [Mesorhizobium neociceri]MBA1142328.1 sugar ABC transporter substrate-binding protein [Mesorhizobium neociceri]
MKCLGLAILAISVAFAGGASAQQRFDGVKIKVLSTNSAYDLELQKFAHEFTEKTGAEVQFNLFGYAPTVQKVSVELLTRSNSYDVVYLGSEEFGRYASGNILEPLDGYIDVKSADVQDFIAPVLRLYSMDGKQYALPHFAATQIMYYRPDLLDKAGIKGPPQTWEEFRNDCALLTKAGIACTTLRGQPDTGENIWFWGQVLYGFGGSYFAKEPTDLTPTVNSPAALDALKWYTDTMTNFTLPGSASATFDDVVIAMQQGRIAMTVEGAPTAGRILDPELSKVVGKLGFALPPAGPSGRFPPFAGQAYVIPAASENKAAAAAFIQWATSADVMKRISLDSTFVAITRQSLWKDKEVLGKHDYNYGHGSFAATYAETLKGAPEWYYPRIPEFKEIGDRLGRALQEAVVGSKSPKAALDDAQADVEGIMKRAGYLK